VAILDQDVRKMAPIRAAADGK